MNKHVNPKLSRQVFSKLVDEHSANLVRYCWHKTGNVETAREIVQELFLKLAKSDFSKVEDHVIPWMYAVCRNLATDALRKQSRLVMTEEQDIDNRNSTKEIDPVKAFLRAETKDLLRSCLENLNERDREVVILKFQNGLSYQDISDITGLSTSNVGYIIHQSVVRLRELMLQKQ